MPVWLICILIFFIAPWLIGVMIEWVIDYIKKHNWKYNIFSIFFMVVVTSIILWVYYDSRNAALAYIPSNQVITMTVKLKEVHLVYNNSVGNEWHFSASVNKKEIDEGNSRNIKISDQGLIIMQATAIEYDNISDHGSNIKYISFNKLNLYKTTKAVIYVTVFENRGRYAGNDAKWKFIFYINRQVTFREILKQVFRNREVEI